MNLKSTLSVLAFKILSKLPFGFTQKLAHGLGTLSYYLPTREKRITTFNIYHALPHIKNKQQLIKKSLQEDSKSLMESAPLWQKNASDILSLLTVHGQHHIEAAKEKGIIFASPHLASWEIIGLWISQYYPTSCLYRRPKIDAMDQIIQDARGKFGAKLVPDTVKGVMLLKKALDRKETICILPDQDPGKNGGVYVSFFNQAARTSTLASKLAQKTNATIIMAHTIRNKHGFDLYFTPVDADTYNSDLKIAAQTLNKEMERIILQKPEQYMWSGKRYRSQENGTNIYSKDKQNH